MNVGANFALNHNRIVEQMEEPRLYGNLVQTGRPLNQIYGLKAIGFFRDEQDIANSPTQTFSTVRPGDIKYEDVNGDDVIDANDQVDDYYESLVDGGYEIPEELDTDFDLPYISPADEDDDIYSYEDIEPYDDSSDSHDMTDDGMTDSDGFDDDNATDHFGSDTYQDMDLM